MSNQVYLKSASVLKSVLHNGMGRYVCQLQRLTFRFSKSHGTAKGLREYIEKDLMDFAKNNPGVVIYLKPRRVGPVSITAEYLNGHTQYKSFPRMPRDFIFKWIEFYRTQSGYPISRFIKNIHTETPSVQGVWNPFTYKSTSLNITEFPNEELSKTKTFFPTATEQLLEIAGNHASDETQTNDDPVQKEANAR